MARKPKRKKYYARAGLSGLNDAKAQVYGEELEKIRVKNGGELTPLKVLEEAKRRNNPLHDYFEWDDGEAAAKYRYNQATNLIGTIAEVVTIRGVRSKQRSFFNTRSAPATAVYVTRQEAVERFDVRRKIIEDIRRHMDNCRDLLDMFLDEEKKAKGKKTKSKKD